MTASCTGCPDRLPPPCASGTNNVGPPEPGGFAPPVALEPVGRVPQGADAGERRLAVEKPAGGLAEKLLVLGELEVHGSPFRLCAAQAIRGKLRACIPAQSHNTLRTSPRSSWGRPATSSRIASSTSARTVWHSCSVHAAWCRVTPSPSSWRTTSGSWRSRGPRSASGLYWTTVNSHLTAPEVEYIVNDCEARVFLSSKRLGEVVAAMKPDATPRVEHRLMVDGVIDGWDSYEKAVAEYPPEPIADECEGGALLYSSGTTGKPKGIFRPLALAPMGEGFDALTAFFAWCGFVDGSVYLSPAPLYHAAPIVWSMAIQRRAGTVVLMERFDAEQALALDRALQRDLRPVRPDHVRAHAQAAAGDARVYDLSSLRSVVHAAAPCPVDVKQQMMDWWGPIIYEYYSSTEGSGRDVHRARGVAGAPGHGRQADGRGGARPRRRRQRAPDRRTGHAVVRGRARLRVPQRPDEDGGGGERARLQDRRRHRLRRRRGVRLPHRPQGAHDHQRRREHLPAGSRERSGDASEGHRRRGVRRARRRSRRAGEGRGAAGRLVRRRPRARAGAGRVLPGQPRALQVPAHRRLRARAPSPRHRQALQGQAARPLLAGETNGLGSVARGRLGDDLLAGDRRRNARARERRRSPRCAPRTRTRVSPNAR